MNKNDGGPAFPCNVDRAGGGDGWRTEYGLTTRDYFAAKAMAAMLDNHGDICDGYREQIALKAYMVADAMLAERSK